LGRLTHCTIGGASVGASSMVRWVCVSAPLSFKDVLIVELGIFSVFLSRFNSHFQFDGKFQGISRSLRDEKIKINFDATHTT